MKHFYAEKRIFVWIVVISILAFLSTNYIYTSLQLFTKIKNTNPSFHSII